MTKILNTFQFIKTYITSYLFLVINYFKNVLLDRRLKKAHKIYTELNTKLILVGSCHADNPPVSFDSFKHYATSATDTIVPLANFYNIYSKLIKAGANDGICANIFVGSRSLKMLSEPAYNPKKDIQPFVHVDELKEPTIIKGSIEQSYVDKIQELSKEWKVMEEQKTERVVLQSFETKGN